MHYFEAIQEPNGTHVVTKARELSSSFYRDVSHAFLISMFKGVDDVLMKHSKIDQGIWWAEVKSKPLPKGGSSLQINISREPPQVITVNLDDDGERSAFRCRAPYKGLNWVNWPSASVRRPEWNRELPLYVQGHALKRLRERVTISGPEVEDFMWQSLLKPTFHVGRQSDEFLVEYRLFENVLGYFPVRRLEDKIIVKTFLFLTMDGTPQQKLLYDRLRLVRPEKEALQLDTLSQFLTTDIQNDPVLGEIFRECGCGQLFDMAKPELREKARRGFAENLRNYLGIGPREAERLLRKNPHRRQA